MLFNSHYFIFLFLPITVLIYFFINSKILLEHQRFGLLLQVCSFMVGGILFIYLLFWDR